MPDHPAYRPDHPKVEPMTEEQWREYDPRPMHGPVTQHGTIRSLDAMERTDNVRDLYTEAGLDAAVREACNAGREVDDDVARAITSAWHGGQSSAFYSFASSGHFDRDDLLHELSRCIDAGYVTASPTDRLQLDMLGTYLINRPKTPEEQAYELGCQHARNAASWVIDGNTARSWTAETLTWIERGDPRVEERLPREPNLSGEYADDPTPQSLVYGITGRARPADEIVDALCDAYESGVSETFQSECERILRAALEN